MTKESWEKTSGRLRHRQEPRATPVYGCARMQFIYRAGFVISQIFRIVLRQEKDLRNIHWADGGWRTGCNWSKGQWHWEEWQGNVCSCRRKPGGHKFRLHRPARHKVNDVSDIISMDAAVARAATSGTGFLIRIKKRNVSVQRDFDEVFIWIILLKVIFSYHSKCH